MKKEKRYVVYASPFNGTAGGFYTPVMEDREALLSSRSRESGPYDVGVTGGVARPVTLLQRLFPKPLSRKVA